MPGLTETDEEKDLRNLNTLMDYSPNTSIFISNSSLDSVFHNILRDYHNDINEAITYLAAEHRHQNPNTTGDSMEIVTARFNRLENAHKQSHR